MKPRLIAVLSLFVVVCTVSADEAESNISTKLRPEALQARIRQHRMGELIIRTKPGAEVKVEQLRHEFWFGTAISNSMVRSSYRWRMAEADLQRYKEVLSANFNSAVHENALKWHHCERSANSGFDYSVAE